MSTTRGSEWQWFGNAGHFICAADCQFHLCTLVGPWLVSTVGQMVPDAPVREIYAKSRGVVLRGQGDTRLADYMMEKIGYEEIGHDRTFETMVFRAGKPCSAPDCGCGLPSIDGNEKDFDGYNDAASATRGHLEMCRKWAETDALPEPEEGTHDG